MKNKRGWELSLIGKIVVILLIVILLAIIINRFLSKGGKGADLYFPCGPGQTPELNNCTLYGAAGGSEAGTTAPAKASGMPVNTNADGLAAAIDRGKPLNSWPHKENLAAQYGGVYEVYTTFDIDDKGKLNYSKVILYTKEKNWKEWCARTFTAAKLEVSVCYDDDINVKLTKMPTQSNPTVDFELSELAVLPTTIMEPDKIYRIPKADKKFYTLKTLAGDFKIGYHRWKSDNSRFLVKELNENSDCGIDKNDDVNVCSNGCFDCDNSLATCEYLVDNKRIRCCDGIGDARGNSVCSKIISEDVNYVDVKFFKSENG